MITKQQRNKTIAAFGILSIVGGIALLQKSVPVKQVTVGWTYTSYSNDVIFDIWHSTNGIQMSNFTPYVQIVGTNIAILKVDKPKEFFIIRAISNKVYSPFSYK